MTNCNLNVIPDTWTNYEHPWYNQLKLLDDSTISESPSQLKHKSETLGQKSTKQCVICSQVKHLEAFPKHIAHKDNLDTRCRNCIREGSKLRNKLRKQNPPPEAGPCPICKTHTTRWVLDHCHDTGSFRGYICDSCNLGLGKLKDNPETVASALNYLLTHGNQI